MEVKRSEKLKNVFQMDHRILPQLSLFPLDIVWGVGKAACILWRALDTGKHMDRLQFSTARRFRSFDTN